MSLAKLAGVVILLASGCQRAADTDGPGSPGDSIAGTETTQDERQPSAGAREQDRSTRASLAHALVAVVSTPATEAAPCERMCGGLGDCLLADPEYAAATAGGLELECLDLCVHSPDDDPAKTEFLACAVHDQCADLQPCAQQSWTALAEIHRSPKLEGGLVSAVVDPCKTGCRWLYACMITNLPPGQGTLSSADEQSMQVCIDACDDNAPDIYGGDGTYTMMTKLAECLPTHCDQNQISECWN